MGLDLCFGLFTAVHVENVCTGLSFSLGTRATVCTAFFHDDRVERKQGVEVASPYGCMGLGHIPAQEVPKTGLSTTRLPQMLVCKGSGDERAWKGCGFTTSTSCCKRCCKTTVRTLSTAVKPGWCLTPPRAPSDVAHTHQPSA